MSAESCASIPTLEEHPALSAPDPTKDEALARQYRHFGKVGLSPSANVDARFAAYDHALHYRRIVNRVLRKAFAIRNRPTWGTRVADIGGNNGRNARLMLMMGVEQVDSLDPAVDPGSPDLQGFAIPAGADRPGIVPVQCKAEDADLGSERYDMVCSFFMLYHLGEPQQRQVLEKMAQGLKKDGVAVITTSGRYNKGFQHDRLQPAIAKWLTFYYNAHKPEDAEAVEEIEPPARMNERFTDEHVGLIEEYFDIVGMEIQDTYIEYTRENLHILIDSVKTLQTEYSRISADCGVVTNEGVPTDTQFEWALKMALVEVIREKSPIELGMNMADIDDLLMNGDWKLLDPVRRIGWVCRRKDRFEEGEDLPPIGDLDNELDELTRKSGRLALSGV